MLNLSDPNYLLIDEIIPEGYIDPDLRDISTKIILEVDELRGTDKYVKWIRETGYKMNQENKIMVLSGIVYLSNIDPDAAMNVIQGCNMKYANFKQVEKALNNRIFDLKVEKAKEEGELVQKEKENKIVTFEQMCVSIEEIFPKVNIDYDITVSKFIAWENKAKEFSKRKSA